MGVIDLFILNLGSWNSHADSRVAFISFNFKVTLEKLANLCSLVPTRVVRSNTTVMKTNLSVRLAIVQPYS